MKRKEIALIIVLVFAAGFIGGIVSGLTSGIRDALAAEYFGDESAGKFHGTLEWQAMKSTIKRTIHRAKVPGGWLVAQQEGITFVPDTSHEWGS
jgi:hypothetical protein